MPKPYTHRYLVMFRDIDLDHWSVDCGFNDKTQAVQYAFNVTTDEKDVAEARIKDNETDAIIFKIETNREAAAHQQS